MHFAEVILTDGVDPLVNIVIGLLVVAGFVLVNLSTMLGNYLSSKQNAVKMQKPKNTGTTYLINNSVFIVCLLLWVVAGGAGFVVACLVPVFALACAYYRGSA